MSPPGADEAEATDTKAQPPQQPAAGLLRTTLNVCFSPSKFFGSGHPFPSKYGPLTAGSLYMAFGLAGYGARISDSVVSGLAKGFGGGLLLAVPSIYLASALSHPLLRRLGGVGTFRVTRDVAAYTCAPMLLHGLIQGEWLALLVGLIVGSVGAARAHGIGSLFKVAASLVAAGLAAGFVMGVVIAVPLAMFLIGFRLLPDEDNMRPTIRGGDVVFASKVSYATDGVPPLGYGDVVLVGAGDVGPGGFHRVMRVLGLPGDRVSVGDEKLIINGWPVPSCHVGPTDPERRSARQLHLESLGGHRYLAAYSPGASATSYGPTEVAVLVMGDDHDGNAAQVGWGATGELMPKENVIGKVQFSWGEAGFSRIDSTPVLLLEDTESQQALEDCLRDAPPASETFPPRPGTANH